MTRAGRISARDNPGPLDRKEETPGPFLFSALGGDFFTVMNRTIDSMSVQVAMEGHMQHQTPHIRYYGTYLPRYSMDVVVYLGTVDAGLIDQEMQPL